MNSTKILELIDELSERVYWLEQGMEEKKSEIEDLKDRLNQLERD